jgi:hypothetical protein
MRKVILIYIVAFVANFNSNAQHSVARQWNEVLLESIRSDFARPTVHARNLFHISAAMYDAWAIYDDQATTYFLGKTVNGVPCKFNGINTTGATIEDQEKAISYATYRLIKHRFFLSPGAFHIYESADSLMNLLGYDKNFTSTNYENGSSAALGNYIAECIINYGLTDGSNEEGEYKNEHYIPSNGPLAVDSNGNPLLTDPNRWQPLTLETFIDQGGNIIPGSTPPFLSPEWGAVKPFSLTQDDLTIYSRDDFDYLVYHDPKDPPYLGSETDEYYKWGFALVSAWSSHLDPTDGVMIDISPASIGNIQNYPTELADYADFYDFEEGGDPSVGRTLNPATQLPYEEQLVPRGDYARVLAEFWADGPDSETPPGHWFTLLNYVSDHPATEKKIGGQGEVIDDLEWDVKSYFLLGGTMHDVAVSSWGIKGWYDYIRPVSAIRYMASQGQSSNSELPNYNENGIILADGLIELIEEGDALAGGENENVNKIKIKAWKGPNYITDPDIDEAGVDWILADGWWPYQRPTFVTPPFAGYVSGHSTYSRAAAVVLSSLTGSEYFPGGMGEFTAKKNEFLVFEEGPSMDIVLQWATYQDASDQCSLSRIWGGIHPPADDLPGREIGETIGNEAYAKASTYFEGIVSGVNDEIYVSIYPNPTSDLLHIKFPTKYSFSLKIVDLKGVIIKTEEIASSSEHSIKTDNLKTGVYIISIESSTFKKSWRFIKQ